MSALNFIQLGIRVRVTLTGRWKGLYDGCGAMLTEMFVCCRKLAVYDDWSDLVIHVAMDNTVIENDIRK